VLYDESPTPKTVRPACLVRFKCPEDCRQRIGAMVPRTRSAGIAPARLIPFIIEMRSSNPGSRSLSKGSGFGGA
jgi:hypothetical protein